MISYGSALTGGSSRASGEPAGFSALTVGRAVTAVPPAVCAETDSDVHRSLGAVGDRVRRRSAEVESAVRIQSWRSSDEPGAKR